MSARCTRGSRRDSSWIVEWTARTASLRLPTGLVVREVIVNIDDDARRLAYSVRSDNLTHHNASFEVLSAGDDRCRLVWIADLLPDEAATAIGAMMGQGVVAMKTALERPAIR